MPFEKRDPIPPGFYWIDMKSIDPAEEKFKRNEFSYWLKVVNRGRDSSNLRVKTLRTTNTWKLFEVISTVPRWTVPQLGFPTIAERGSATTPDDTILTDKEADWKNPIDETVKTYSPWIAPAIAATVGLIIIASIASMFRGPQTIRLIAK